MVFLLLDYVVLRDHGVLPGSCVIVAWWKVVSVKRSIELGIDIYA